MEEVRAEVAITVLLLVQLATAEPKGVTWTSIDPFCGRLKSLEPDAFPISRAEVKLYRSKAKHIQCCTSAELVSRVRLSAEGRFDLRKQTPGQYWLTVKWNTTEVAVALWFDGKKKFACDDRYNNIIEVWPSSGTAVGTVITSTDSTIHAQTH